jgi:hypothetical protein
MQISVVTVYRLELTQEEYNLVGLALCGRIKPEQEQDAHELNKRMLEGRKRVHADHVHLVDRAMDSLGYQEV